MISTSLLTVNCGDSFTHMVLDAVTNKIIYRSALSPRTLKDLNKRLFDAGGEADHQPHENPTKHHTLLPNREKSAPSDTPTVYINSRHDDGPTSSKPLPRFNPDDLVGRTFLLPPGYNGERLTTKVTRKVVEDIEQADGERLQNLSFILGIGNGKLEEIISSTNLLIIGKLQTMMTTISVMICSTLEPSLVTRDPSSQQTPIGKDASIMSL